MGRRREHFFQTIFISVLKIAYLICISALKTGRKLNASSTTGKNSSWALKAEFRTLLNCQGVSEAIVQ